MTMRVETEPSSVPAAFSPSPSQIAGPPVGLDVPMQSTTKVSESPLPITPSGPRFELRKTFVEQYRSKDPGFGFNGLGLFTYLRTYARIKDDGEKEQWWETVERVTNGTYTIQKRHILQHGLGWDDVKAQESAEEFYDRLFHMKFTAPGRGLWMMGTEFVETRGGAALNNCAFHSTADIDKDFSSPFAFMMDASMLGVGVGFDADGAGKKLIKKPTSHNRYTFQIPDSREGWVESLIHLLESYENDGSSPVDFDYSLIRPAGVLIKGFGGKASGPEPLVEMHEKIRATLDGLDGKPITSTAIVDIMNFIGCCVVAGNVRRSAQIALGPAEDEYLSLKAYRWDQTQNKFVGPRADRAVHGWASNNSIRATLGMDYTEISKHIRNNGEPGLYWMENVQTYARMGHKKKDKATGVNPCAEQALESGEMCTLVETFPSRHESLEDYKRTLKFAYLYAKSVTLTKTHWTASNRVMLRNRRIGVSMTGIAQFVGKQGVHELIKWSREGYETVGYYDNVYSDWLCVPKSVRMTTVKPSGTVSLLAGVTPGIHFPQSRYYIRRVRVAAGDELVDAARQAGMHVEPELNDPNGTMVVSFPIDSGDGVRAQKDVSMWEQLHLAALMQEHWSDNAVSCTITFQPHEADQIKQALDFFQYKLKTVSFLPYVDPENTAYAQLPYEPITAEQYQVLTASLKPLLLGKDRSEAKGTRYCDGDSCLIG